MPAFDQRVADAGLLVQRLDQRHLALLVALGECRTKSFERVVPELAVIRARRQPAQDVGATNDLVRERSIERGGGGRADEVDLEKTRRIDGGGEGLQPARDAAVPGRFRAEPAAVERFERRCDLRQLLRQFLRPLLRLSAPPPAPQPRLQGPARGGGPDR